MADCLEWSGQKRRGYGRRWVDGRLVTVHRWTWEQANGPVPPGMAIMHSCDNRACYQLEHLRIGTVLENNADRDAKGRTARGEASSGVKLSVSEVAEIRIALATGESHRSIASRFGVSHNNVGAISRGKTWRVD